MKTALKRVFSLFFVTILMFCMFACAPSEQPPEQPPTLTMADVFEIRCIGLDHGCSSFVPSPHCTIEDLMREDNTYRLLDTEYIVTKYDIRITSTSLYKNAGTTYLQNLTSSNGEYNAGDIITEFDGEENLGTDDILRSLVIEFELL